MLISFTVDNWMSFRDRSSLSMVASRERQHRERLPYVPSVKVRLLPIAAVYGGNASGKTNLFKALNFVRHFVVNGTRPEGTIAVAPFLLSDAAEQPVRFALEILVGDKVYDLSFAASTHEVVEEKLVEISGSRERILYHRKKGNPSPRLDASLDNRGFLEFAFQGTRDNQLYLTNAVSQKVERFKPVYDWFRDTLLLIAPDSRFGAFEEFFAEGSRSSILTDALQYFDTGIAKLDSEEVPFNSLQLPQEVHQGLQEALTESTALKLMNTATEDRVIVTKRDGKLSARRLVALHTKNDGTQIAFPMHLESDGSQRIIDLLPAFSDMSGGARAKVCVIDEIDRSLHTLVTRKLLGDYLANCGQDSRSQLLFTTHDVLLMDQQLLRRDEMWVTERNASGASKLISFSEYKDVRYDKDIRKSYLQGRLGGIPRLLLSDTFRGVVAEGEADI